MTNKPEDARSSLSLSAAIPGSAWQMETRPAAVVAATITAERAARVRREAAAALANLLEVQDGEPRLKAPVDDAFMVVSSLLAELRATSVA